MRILQLAPLWESVPPPAYGGTEAVVHLLTEELVRMGHDVTLVASGDSLTAARLAPVFPRSLRRADDLADRNPYDWAHIAHAIDLSRCGFDVVHNHAGELAMAMAPLAGAPMLTTTHCLTTADTRFIWRRYRGAYNTISRSQRAHFDQVGTGARFMGHVYNAIDVASYPFQREKGEDLLFLSRLAPEKGPHLAIAVAKRLGMRLILAGKVDRFDRDFFEEVVRDQIDGEQIVFVGEADARRKRDLYRNARCLLMPLTWEEPFGLVMPEAMACGTPVIALRRGSAPELIVHGETGFVVDTVDEMADAVLDLGRIDPARCRDHVQAEFSVERMARAYLRLYEALSEPLREATIPVEFTVPRSPAYDDDGVAVA
ncbi:MAG TPA: glycosyltransferase family 4 protein [Dehalococcoidia bacterium]|jgi:glycosyltransferase involved in cell wall biosynthesis|nr:glycosyltransferase family 4 protein [Dehalococcoidia bacterium]